MEQQDQPQQALVGQPGELQATIQIKRAATGKVETYILTGRVGGHQPALEEPNGSHALDRGA